jgi:hypothetical protein
LGLFEFAGLISLQAIALGGIAATVGRLPAQVEIRFLEQQIIGGEAFPRPYMQRINRYPLLATTVVASGAALLLSFCAGRRFARQASPHFRRVVSLGAASLACLAFVTLLSLVWDFDYLLQQIWFGDWRYVLGGEWINIRSAMHSRSVHVAATAVCVIVGFAAIPRLSTGR